jgi:hypothetical protein
MILQLYKVDLFYILYILSVTFTKFAMSYVKRKTIQLL